MLPVVSRASISRDLRYRRSQGDSGGLRSPRFRIFLAEYAGMKPGVTSAVLVLVIVCLAAVDRFLAAVESEEANKTAARSYLSGSRLLEQGKTGEAIDFLREAHALERQNSAYELQLITALTTAGKITEAEPLLTDILQRAPNDGRANLIAARWMIRKGNTAEAEAYYHRAIYGEWSGDPLPHRVQVRMELIDLLLEKNKKAELLPELISLEAESPAGGPLQKRLAELFLLAGSPSACGQCLCGHRREESKGYFGIRRLGRGGARRRAVSPGAHRLSSCIPARSQQGVGSHASADAEHGHRARPHAAAIDIGREI